MAKVSRAAVLSCARKYTVAELVTKLDAATEAVEANAGRDVVVTATNFKDGGSSGELVEGNAEFLVELYAAALKVKRRWEAGQKAAANRGRIDFGRRVWLD
jgi:hypothetical protein